MGFNAVVVNKFFKLWENTIDKYNFSPDRIFNCDETGISSVGKCNPKIIAQKGKKQIGSIASAERGKTVTIEICMSASGNFMPPMFIFPRVRMKDCLLDNAPPNSTAMCHKTGWMQLDIFFEWFKKFVSWSRASKENMVLLLLDDHMSHTKNIKVIDYARDNGVVILCFPPHCTHRLQPLDVGFMKPLSTYYSEEVKKWLRVHPGRVVAQEDIAGLFAEAFYKAPTIKIAINSFKATGIWPTNPDVFSESDFITASVTNIDNENPHIQDLNGTNKDTVSDAELPGSHMLNAKGSPPLQQNTELLQGSRPQRSVDPIQMPGPSYQDEQVLQMTPHRNIGNNSVAAFAITPEDISPSPKSTVKKRSSKNRGKTAIITESPYKQELEAKLQGNKCKKKSYIWKKLQETRQCFQEAKEAK